MRMYDNTDLDTLKERDLGIKLTDEETTDLLRIATQKNTTVEDILEDFVANLTDSVRSRGSDERELAYEYVERCIYSFDDNESFVQWLSIDGQLDERAKDLDVSDTMKEELTVIEDPEEIEQTKKDIAYCTKEIEYAYQEYKDADGKEDHDEAIRHLRRYLKTKERLSI